MVKVKNRSTQVVSQFTDAEWSRISNDPQWSGVFEQVKEVRVPKEVRDLQSASNGTQSPKGETVPVVETAKPPKDDKKTQPKTGDDKK